MHTLKYELGSVLRRDWPGYSDLGVKVGEEGGGSNIRWLHGGNFRENGFAAAVSAGDSRQWEIEIDDSGVYN